MSARRAGSEEGDDRYADLFVDAEDEVDDPDYEDDGEEDEDDVSHDNADDDEFHDAEEGDEIQFIVEVDDAGNDDNDEDDGGDEDDQQRRLIHLLATSRAAMMSRRQMMEFMRRVQFVQQYGDDDDFAGHQGRNRRRNLDPDRFPKVPSEKGRELMCSGTFGANDTTSSRFAQKKRIARSLLDRELGIGGARGRKIQQGVMKQNMIPATDAEMIINYDDCVYSGQFSDDGNFFYACVKDLRVRMYDTSNPYNWRHYKTVSHPSGAWTLTDASLSPDNKWLAYTSMRSSICLAPTDPNDTGDPYSLNLSTEDARHTGWGRGFGIYSTRFSGDGRELVAGTNANSIVVFDIESRRVLHTIRGHEDHVNAVCFADKSSPNIVYSGSDDTTIKVWDRRSIGAGREAGAFVGHIEGLTYIDSKGDGTYILSNAKDQSAKLWDLRMMYSSAQFHDLAPTQVSDFDYRWGEYDQDEWFPHPNDNSLVTFRGHKVLRTLIRCHFSPPGSSDSRYVYSGSFDGKVYIWNMDATIAGIIDVKEATARASALPQEWRQFHRGREFQGWSTCVRDAAWHPNAPFIAASSLNGWDHSLGTVSVHSFNEARSDEGEPKMGAGYTDKLRPVTIDEERDDSDDADYAE